MPFLARNPLQATHYRRGYKRPLASKFHVIIIPKIKYSPSQKRIITNNSPSKQTIETGGVVQRIIPKFFSQEELCLCLIEKDSVLIGLFGAMESRDVLSGLPACSALAVRSPIRQTYTLLVLGTRRFRNGEGWTVEKAGGACFLLFFSLSDDQEMRWMFILGVFLIVFQGWSTNAVIGVLNYY